MIRGMALCGRELCLLSLLPFAFVLAGCNGEAGSGATISDFLIALGRQVLSALLL